MDLKSYSRWYDYSRARDEMFKATDTPWAPWYVVRSDDKKRARLNVITHLLAHIPYEEVPREKVKLPDRQKPHGYKEPDYPYKFVPRTDLAEPLHRRGVKGLPTGTGPRRSIEYVVGLISTPQNPTTLTAVRGSALTA